MSACRRDSIKPHSKATPGLLPGLLTQPKPQPTSPPETGLQRKGPGLPAEEQGVRRVGQHEQVSWQRGGLEGPVWSSFRQFLQPRPHSRSLCQPNSLPYWIFYLVLITETLTYSLLASLLFIGPWVCPVQYGSH